MAARKATVDRDTLETQITATVNLDGTGETAFATGVPFLKFEKREIYPCFSNQTSMPCVFKLTSIFKIDHIASRSPLKPCCSRPITK